MRLALSVLTVSALAWVTLAQQEGGHGRYPRHHHSHAQLEQQASSAKAFKPIEGGRRLDAYDDRMAGYEAQGKYWEQWAIDHGYAPGPNSKYGKPPQQPQQPQQQPQQPQQQQPSNEAQWVPVDGSNNKQTVGGVGGNEFGDYFNLAFYQNKAKDLEAWAQQGGMLPTYQGTAAKQSARGDDNEVVDMPRRLPSSNSDDEPKVDMPRRLPSRNDDNEGPVDIPLRRLPTDRDDDVVDMPRRLAEESAFDERVSYYKALSDWQQAYWQDYAKGWATWSQKQGFVPSSSTDVPRRLAGEGGEEEVPKDAFDERMEEYKATADYYQALGEWEKDYWTAYGNGWAKWTVDQGFAPSPESKIYQQQHVQQAAKDSVDTATETVNRYEAVASQETAYWQEQAKYRKEKGAARGQAWVDWAVRQGYMPAPPTPAEQPEAVGEQEEATSRRLDAFDDRMARYEAIGKFEEEYWKQRGKGWEQWAIDQGYAPGPNSKYGKPAQTEEEWRAEQAQQEQVAGGDKAEAIRGDFYKSEGRSWAEWFRTQTFGEDGEALNLPQEALTGTPGFEGKKGPVEYIVEKLRMDVGASGDMAAVPESSVSDKAVEDVYKHQTWVGRSAARVVNGVENGAEHAYKAGERVVSRAEDAAKSAIGAAAPVTPIAPSAKEQETVPEAAPEAAVPVPQKHKHMRGVAK